MGRDRFNELQGYSDREDTAIEMGHVGQGYGNSGGGGGAGDPAGYPDGQFFYLLDNATKQMAEVDTNIDQIANFHEQALNAASESRYRQIAGQRDQLVEETNSMVSGIKQSLDVLARTVDDPNIPKTQRVAQASRQQNLARKFSEQLQRYRQMEYRYSQRNRERFERQYRIARPEATDEEITEAINSDQAGQVFAQAVMQSNRLGEARRVLRDVEERQVDIQKIEKTISELAEMFVEVNDMVNRQQDMIDNIESAVEATHGNVEMANTETQKAIVNRIKARKKLWIILLLSIVLIVIIIVIIYFTVIKK
ncbi:Plasma membrane t-SNARE, secretory vesicle fusion [Coemansia sp. RSA 2599]|nr:Plasma membrane t-SNARE, secretory vesicle fusion [Coemansia sp. RSA 2598]KAJ1826763.1 Plasma membrane t-SNARE, secretory vesicle fusion [Coemansia sp. RSA 2599]